FQAEDGIRDRNVTGVQTCALPILAEAATALFAEKGVRMTAEDFRPFIGMGEDRYIGGPAKAKGIPLDPERDKARLYEIYEEVIQIGRASCRERVEVAVVAV